MTIIMVVVCGLVLPQGTPAGAMLDDPVEQGLLKADIVSHLFALNPFVTKDFSPFGQKLLIEGGFVEHIIVILCG